MLFLLLLFKTYFFSKFKSLTGNTFKCESFELLHGLGKQG